MDKHSELISSKARVEGTWPTNRRECSRQDQWMSRGPGKPEGRHPQRAFGALGLTALRPMHGLTPMHPPVAWIPLLLSTSVSLTGSQFLEPSPSRRYVSVLSYGTHWPFSLAFTVLQCVQFTSIRMPSSDPQWIFILL